MIDWARWAASQGRAPNLLDTTYIAVSDLEAAVVSQGTVLRAGDILFIRSGFVQKLQSLARSEVQAYMSQDPAPPIMGLQAGEAMLRWLWDHEFAAVAGDMLTLEAQPFPDTHILHEWLIAGWGMPIGELFDLDRLAEECAKRQRWSFFFSSVPLKVGRDQPQFPVVRVASTDGSDVTGARRRSQSP